ncbi:hypothetical protein [Tenacibaculum agarivorans]|uniref:hypothetical protein n=1 Tax=Tenacibaculum agarivorans TaxID=1908389 RepID=UPI00094BB240|nr:hypothetical protein [Tenacibaculum agarivorans]
MKKHFSKQLKKVSILIPLLLIFLVSCQKETEIIPETTANETQSENVVTDNSITSHRISNHLVNTNTREIVGQFFSNPDFSGRVYTLSFTNFNLSKPFKLPFEAKSWVVAPQVSILTKQSTRISAKNRTFIGSKNHGSGIVRKGIQLYVAKHPTKYQHGTYAGQLWSKNGKHQLPIFSKVDLGLKPLRNFFHNKVGKFIPATTSKYNYVFFHQYNSFKSEKIAARPSNTHGLRKHSQAFNPWQQNRISSLTLVSGKFKGNSNKWDDYFEFEKKPLNQIAFGHAGQEAFFKFACMAGCSRNFADPLNAIEDVLGLASNNKIKWGSCITGCLNTNFSKFKSVLALFTNHI